MAVLLLLFFNIRAHAQIHISNEVGVLAGPAAFFTDYGERWNVRSNLENGGFGIGLVHYMHFAYKERCSCYTSEGYFSDHFKIRSEFDYMQSRLEHVGPVAQKKTEGGKQLRAMHGFTETYELGMHLEYYPFSVRDFMNFGYWISPYISLGVHYVHFAPDAYSDLGSFDDPGVLFPTFKGGLDLSPGNTWAVAGSMGFRYKVSVRHDLLFDARWHYYYSDYVDGLNVQGLQNQFNDMVFWFSIGYVYYINF